MEFFIVMISVPLFLLILLVFALVVLPRYPRREPAQGASPAESAPGAHGAPPAEKPSGADKGPTTMASWGVTLLLYAAFVVAIISAFKLHKEK